MKTHHYLAGQEKVCHKKRPMIRIEGNKFVFPRKAANRAPSLD